MIYTLTELAAKYKTDKGIIDTSDNQNMPVHDYTVFYDKIFFSVRNKNLNVLDIGGWGANNGGSSRMFKEYFNKSIIFSIDLNSDVKNLENEGIITLSLDLDNEPLLKQKLKNWNVKFDIVVEDASHWPKQQIRTLIHFLPYLNQNSIYIIEDIPHNIESIEDYFFQFLSNEEISLFKNFILENYIIQTNQLSKLVYFKIR